MFLWWPLKICLVQIPCSFLCGQRVTFHEFTTIQHPFWQKFLILRVKSVIMKPNQFLFPLLVADISRVALNRIEPYDYILKAYLLWSLMHKPELSDNRQFLRKARYIFLLSWKSQKKELCPTWFIKQTLTLKKSNFKIKLRYM